MQQRATVWANCSEHSLEWIAMTFALAVGSLQLMQELNTFVAVTHWHQLTTVWPICSGHPPEYSKHASLHAIMTTIWPLRSGHPLELMLCDTCVAETRCKNAAAETQLVELKTTELRHKMLLCMSMLPLRITCVARARGRKNNLFYLF